MQGRISVKKYGRDDVDAGAGHSKLLPVGGIHLYTIEQGAGGFRGGCRGSQTIAEPGASYRLRK